MPEDQTIQQNPVYQYPQEVPEQELEHPGLESQMDMRPDYGEETYRGSGRLTGKAAIVTGGDSGIGRAVALAFAREGADVLISYLEEEESDARDTVRIVEESGKKAVPVPGDIRNESHCQDRRSSRAGVRQDRCPGKQRCLPDGPQRYTGDLLRAVRPHVQDEHLRDL